MQIEVGFVQIQVSKSLYLALVLLYSREIIHIEIG